MQRLTAPILLATAVALLAASPEKSPTQPYYPLAVGNRWQYVVQPAAKGARESKVLWRMTSREVTAAGSVHYQVWPAPMQADDEVMQLTISEMGVSESQTVVLKAAPRTGDHWTGSTFEPNRTFSIISAGRACSAGPKQFPDCAVVEERDLKTQTRTVTSYAKYVGPVKYQYFLMKPGGKNELLQTVTLQSFSRK